MNTSPLTLGQRLVAVALAGTLVACSGSSGDRSAPIPNIEAPPREAPSSMTITDPVVVTSPDETLSIELGLVERGALAYRVDIVVNGEPRTVVNDSLLGVDTTMGTFLDDVAVIDVGTPELWSSEIDAVSGKHRSHRLDGTARTLIVAPSGGPTPGTSAALLAVDIVATDAAAAFRLRLIEDDRAASTAAAGAGAVTVLSERTEFAFPETSTAWMQQHDRPGAFTPAYERLVAPARSLERPIPSTPGYTLPALFEHDDVWTLIAEAGLERGWAGSHLSGEVDGGRLRLALPNPFEGFGVGESEPTGALPLVSPWRVVLASPDLADIVESDIVRHLSATPDARDWSWVEPGRVSWSWWADTDSPTNPERLIDYVELSAALGWEYTLIDANWNEMPDEDLERVIARAEALGVGVLLWYNSGGRHNPVTEAPRDRMADPASRRAELSRIADLGVSGVKVDFFHSDKPDRIAQYLDILSDAADEELLVNFHGSTIPRGWSRTWPNLMTMEAVAGNEQYIFNAGYVQQAPRHNTILPFMRNVVGPMDFTPTFLQDLPRGTTRAHELALPIVFESGLTHFVDTPETYLSQPPQVQAILADVPTVWDDVVLLAGRPESHVVLARFHAADAGEPDGVAGEWWIGAINGTTDSIPIQLDAAALERLTAVTPLDSDGASWVCDSADVDAGADGEGDGPPYAIGDGLLPELVMQPNGGCVIRVPVTSQP